MKIYLTKPQVMLLSDGRTIECEGETFRASNKIRKSCEDIIKHKSILENYIVVLDNAIDMWNVYLVEGPKMVRGI